MHCESEAYHGCSAAKQPAEVDLSQALKLAPRRHCQASCRNSQRSIARGARPDATAPSPAGLTLPTDIQSAIRLAVRSWADPIACR